MEPILGLILFSLLLTTGSGLQCETCTAMSDTCSGSKVTCPSGADACISVVFETTTGSLHMKTAVKSCDKMSHCEKLKSEVGKSITTQSASIPAGAFIRKLECSKATVSSPSLLLALSGLLLMKFLF